VRRRPTPLALALPGLILGPVAVPLTVVSLFVLIGLPSYLVLGLPLGWWAVRRAGPATSGDIFACLIKAGLIAHAIGTCILLLYEMETELNRTGGWSGLLSLMLFYGTIGTITMVGMGGTFMLIYVRLARRRFDLSPTGAPAP
jgi:hypothetical protein